MVTVGNLLGYAPKRNVANWMKKSVKKYPYLPDEARILRPAEVMASQPENENGDMEEPDTETRKFPGWQDLNHKKIHTVSLIDDALWSKANWSGVIYATKDLNYAEPPGIALMFKDIEAGKKIFQNWKTEFGKDIQKKLRIGIIKGINHKEPFWYTITIGSVIDKDKMKEGHLSVFAARMCTMTPTTPDNLARFETAFKQYGGCMLVPALFKPDVNKPEVFPEAAVLCRNLEIKEAWQIGLNDMDMVVIKEFKPVIPSDVKDAPVLKLLQRKIEKLGHDSFI